MELRPHPLGWQDLCLISLPCAHLYEPRPHPHTLPPGSTPGARSPRAHPPSPPQDLKWIEEGIPKDPFLNPDLMKNNPWVEKGKCAIL